MFFVMVVSASTAHAASAINGFNPDANDWVYPIAIQSDGKILVGGGFASIGGQTRNRIARLSADEAALQSLSVSSDGHTITWMRGQSSPEVYDVVFEHSTNMTLWTHLGTGTRIPGGWQLTGLSLPFNQIGYVRATGKASGGMYNSSTSLIESVRQYYNPTYNLVINKTGTGSGTVTSSPAGINCGTDCTEAYVSGTVVTLTAIPNAGSSFAGWSGDCDVNGQVTMDADKSCTATFTLNQYTITTSANPVAGGSVTCNPNPVNHGSTSTCTITTNAGYTLQNVGGTCGGTLSGNTYTTNPITGNCTVQANFSINQYTLTVTKTGTGSGTVTSNPAGINCGADCTEPYASGTVVTLTAQADAGSTFAGWSGDADCSDGQVTMNANKTCTAAFEPKPDLTGSWTAMTKKIIKFGSSYRGESIKGTLKVDNIGNSQVPSGVRILFYLSNDGTSLNKYITVAKTSAPINPNSYINVPFTYYSRSSVTGKYIIAVLDSNNQIDEVSETNNNVTSSPLP